MTKTKLLLSMALLATCLPLAGCATQAQLKQIAEEEGITIEEARQRQLRKAEDLEEAVPGIISGAFGGGGH